jgi:hypothetical protein
LLLQWLNLLQWLSCPSSLPVVAELVPMESIPLQEVSESPAWEVPIDSPILDSDGNFVLAVPGMEVRGPVIAVEHGDDYPQESRDLRHALFSKLPAQRLLQLTRASAASVGCSGEFGSVEAKRWSIIATLVGANGTTIMSLGSRRLG